MASFSKVSEAKWFVLQCRGYKPYPKTLLQRVFMNRFQQQRDYLIEKYKLAKKTNSVTMLPFIIYLLDNIPRYLSYDDTRLLYLAQKVIANNKN